LKLILTDITNYIEVCTIDFNCVKPLRVILPTVGFLYDGVVTNSPSVVLDIPADDGRYWPNHVKDFYITLYILGRPRSNLPVYLFGGWGAFVEAERSQIPFLTTLMDPFNLSNLSSHILTLELTQPLTEMCTRDLGGGDKARPARKT
jgi:hypothetical protein